MSHLLNETGARGDPRAPGSKVGLVTPDCYLDYTANLDPDFALPFYPPTKCDPKYIVLQCKCSRTIVPSTCMSLDCLGCKDHVGKRRARSVARRLIGYNHSVRKYHHGKPVIYTVLTVPKEIRERFYLNHDAWRKARKKLWYVLKNYFGGKFGVEATHPSGDKNPNVFHPHLNFLWIQRRGFRAFIDVDRLRAEWQKILDVDTADVYSQYSSDVRRIMHWSKYVTRVFPGNHQWTGPLRWFGKYPKIKIVRECHCDECQCRFRVIGFIDARLVREYEDTGMLIGRDPPWYNDSLIQFVKGKEKSL